MSLAARLQRWQPVVYNGKKLSKSGPAVTWKAHQGPTQILGLKTGVSKLFCKELHSELFSFMGHMVSFETPQLCHHSMETAIGDM